jgi:hypothetical protein
LWLAGDFEMVLEPRGTVEDAKAIIVSQLRQLNIGYSLKGGRTAAFVDNGG